MLKQYWLHAAVASVISGCTTNIDEEPNGNSTIIHDDDDPDVVTPPASADVNIHESPDVNVNESPDVNVNEAPDVDINEAPDVDVNESPDGTQVYRTEAAMPMGMRAANDQNGCGLDAIK
jgi:hypothetical protein